MLNLLEGEVVQLHIRRRCSRSRRNHSSNGLSLGIGIGIRRIKRGSRCLRSLRKVIAGVGVDDSLDLSAVQNTCRVRVKTRRGSVAPIDFTILHFLLGRVLQTHNGKIAEDFGSFHKGLIGRTTAGIFHRIAGVCRASTLESRNTDSYKTNGEDSKFRARAGGEVVDDINSEAIDGSRDEKDGRPRVRKPRRDAGNAEPLLTIGEDNTDDGDDERNDVNELLLIHF